MSAQCCKCKTCRAEKLRRFKIVRYIGPQAAIETETIALGVAFSDDKYFVRWINGTDPEVEYFEDDSDLEKAYSCDWDVGVVWIDS